MPYGGLKTVFGIDSILSLTVVANIVLHPTDMNIRLLSQLFFGTGIDAMDLPTHPLPPRLDEESQSSEDYEQAVQFYAGVYFVRELYKEGDLTFEECMAKASTYSMPENLALEAEKHDFSGYGDRWAYPFCVGIELNDIFFPAEPK